MHSFNQYSVKQQKTFLTACLTVIFASAVQTPPPHDHCKIRPAIWIEVQVIQDQSPEHMKRKDPHFLSFLNSHYGS